MHAKTAFFAPSPSRQLGGTLLGLILGIVIGLGIALGVALYMAKVPVPFIHKASSRSTEQNRDWDPNTPLHSRSAGGAVTPMPAARSGNNAPSRPVPAPAEVSRPATQAAPAPTQAQQTTSSDPLGDFIAARTARQSQQRAGQEQTVASASPIMAGEPFIYFVQAGAFRDQDEAEAQRARLTLAGIQARVTSHEQAGRTVYRVRIGPFQKKDEADSAKERVVSSGFDAALVRVQR